MPLRPPLPILRAMHISRTTHVDELVRTVAEDSSELRRPMQAL